MRAKFIFFVFLPLLTGPNMAFAAEGTSPKPIPFLLAHIVENGVALKPFAKAAPVGLDTEERSLKGFLAKRNFEATFAEFRGRSAKEQILVCAELTKLNDEYLAMLEEEVLDPANTYLDSCRDRLRARIEKVFEHDRDELQREFGPLESASHATKDKRQTAQDRCAGKIGNNPPIEVSVKGGPAYGTYNISRVGPHVVKVPGLQPMEIIWTMDDGPWPGRTEKALAALRENCVEGTFFVVGRQSKVAGGSAVIKAELDGGHNLGNHSFTHPNFSSRTLSTASRLVEITQTENLLRAYLEDFKKQSPEKADRYVLAPFFRFPGGNESLDAIKYLRSHNIASFTWEDGANDWYRNATATNELREALREVEATKGGILLIHDRVQASVDMLPYLLSELTKRGYKIRHMIPKAD